MALDSIVKKPFAKDPSCGPFIAMMQNSGNQIEAARQWAEANCPVQMSLRFVRNVIVWVALSYLLLVILVYTLTRWPPPQEQEAEVRSAETVAVSQMETEGVSEYESQCNTLVGIPFENCLTESIIKAEHAMDLIESQIVASVDAVVESGLMPESGVPADSWKYAIWRSNLEWLEYRDSTCEMIHYLMWPGSGIGRSIQTCRLRMTLERIDDLRRFGDGFPDYF